MRMTRRGVVAAAGDEATVIRKVEAGSFAGMDFVFFAGSAAATKEALGGGTAGWGRG